MTTDSSGGAGLKRDQVREYLRELVESLTPGDPVPSERTLCVQLGVSRPTLRAGVDELVAAGLLVREHGRGTFVAPAKIVQELTPSGGGDPSFSVPRASGSWTSQVLEFTPLPAGAAIGRRLRLSPAAPILHIVLLRLVDGEPMAIEHLHVPADLLPGLTPDDLEHGDLYQLMAGRGVHVHQAVQAIEPTVVSEREARVLAVPPLSPALRFDRLTTDETGRPVEYVHSLYRGDRYRIVSRISLADPSPTAPGDSRHHPGIPPGDLTTLGTGPTVTTGDIQPLL
ncbi:MULTISPECIES: GntR family transcriptional regulator [Kitasatospora]|uniref:Putative GntR family transcriptional regulator n=1 Tax=Kitasatospora setae (strain ATCC 33774 / DSM 43861 / JCM 3304 / KCC A-0304 / NBRC 14216 / KM-6054) TaxID=452652 RepID=E4N484_KITSK|nr:MULTISPECIES: GntR family transcriptional regulator [Kitasatospora]BAJ26015.1 putative GntR family transcriptional regulator [Kitasatospora setae KM-6054]